MLTELMIHAPIHAILNPRYRRKAPGVGIF